MSNQENVFETILAPMTGTAVAITEVPDPIFIEKILGDGIAIVPTEGKVVSPVDGIPGFLSLSVKYIVCTDVYHLTV